MFQIPLSQDFNIWKKELFGPILTIHPYDDEDLEKTAKVCVEISGTNLTGSVFYNDEKYDPSFSHVKVEITLDYEWCSMAKSPFQQSLFSN